MPYIPSSPEITRWCALVISVVLFFPAVASIVSLVEAERTGFAYYNPTSHYPATERVGRRDSPAEFGEAVTQNAEGVVICGSVSVISLT